MKKRTFLFVLLILLVPAALVYLAALARANHRMKLYAEGVEKGREAAIAYVAKVNELRVKMPGQPLEALGALVSPPLPHGYTLHPVTAAEREEYPWLKGSDFFVHQDGPPRLFIPNNGPPVNMDLNAAAVPPAAKAAK